MSTYSYSDSSIKSTRYSRSPSSSPVQGGTPLLGFSIDLETVPDGFRREEMTEDDDCGWSSAEEVPQPLPCIPVYPPPRATSASPSVKGAVREGFSPAVLRLLCYAVVGLAALLLSFGPNLGASPKLPVDSAAFVTFRHASLGLELVNELSRLPERCNKRDFCISEALRLSSILKSNDPQSSSDLLLFADRLSHIDVQMDTPEKYVAMDGLDHARKLGIASRLLKIVAPEGPRNFIAEQALEGVINEYFAKDVPSSLRRLSLQLQTARTDVELALAKRERLLTSITHHRQELGLIKPETWMWWRVKAWENDALVQDRVRVVEGVLRSFEILSSYKEFLDKCLKAVEAYKSTNGVFESLDQYPKSSEDAEGRTNHYLGKVQPLLKELEEHIKRFTRKPEASKQKI